MQGILQAQEAHTLGAKAAQLIVRQLLIVPCIARPLDSCVKLPAASPELERVIPFPFADFARLRDPCIFVAIIPSGRALSVLVAVPSSHT